MSSSERLATIGAMIALSRAGFFPGWAALKSPSCFCRYSANWPAILGLAAATLLPSAAWQAAQTWPAMRCPLAAFCAAAVPTTTESALSASRRSIPGAPWYRWKGAILLEFLPSGSHESVLASAVSRLQRRPRGHAAAGSAGARLRRPLECRQVERDQRADRAQTPCFHAQDSRTHADHQLLRARSRRAPGGPSGLRVREGAARGARWLAHARRLLRPFARHAGGRGARHGCAPSAHRARSAAGRFSWRRAPACAAFEGRQAPARGAGEDPVRGQRGDESGSQAFLEPDATGCRRMPRPAGALARLARPLRQIAGIKNPR